MKCPAPVKQLARSWNVFHDHSKYALAFGLLLACLLWWLGWEYGKHVVTLFAIERVFHHTIGAVSGEGS